MTTPFVGSIDGGLTPFNRLGNPFPLPGGVLQPSGASEGLLTLAGQGIGFTSVDRRQPLAQQFQVSVQRELPGNFLVDAAYVGNRGDDLALNQPLNAIPESFRAAAETTLAQTGRNVLNDSVTNPFFGLIASGPLSARTVTRGQLLRPFPLFTGVTANAAPLGSSRFDALQVKVTKRLSAGLSLTAAYANSKQLERTRYLNDQDAEPVRELAEFDIPQRFVLSTTYELPFGPGRALLGGAKGAAARLVGGWQLNVIYTAQGGVPLDIAGAESLGRSAKLDGDQQTVTRWFDTDAFRPRQPLELVRTSRLPDVRSAGKNNFDLSVFKNTTLTEQLRLQFRAEAFNALNRPEWSSPNTTFGNANFGRVTTTNTFARQIQFGLKLLW